jgi:peptidoglycan hydrolase-like protein with peptidoglycan-binding domain
MSSSDVSVLQNYLKQTGFLASSVETTFYFGSLTEAAVKSLQQARNIEATGIVGPLTRASIASNQTGAAPTIQPVTSSVVTTYSAPITLRIGMQHPDVVRLQNILKRLGFFPATVASTESFGPVTKKAVQYFQRVYNIASSGTEATTGYGMAGQRTWAKLLSL